MKVKIIGWLHEDVDLTLKRELLLRDGERILKCIIPENAIIGETKLLHESLIEVKGEVKGDRLYAKEVKILIKPLIREHPKIEPLPEEDPEKIAKYSYLYIRHPKIVKILKVQHWLLHYIREFLSSKGFIEVLSPMISPCSDPGLRGARKLHTKYYGATYELMSSIIMFKQSSVASLKKIFFVARNVREEPVENLKTGRHLCEFTQVDVEWAHASMHKTMELCEELICYTIRKLLENETTKAIIEEFNPKLEVPKRPFKKLTYDEAVEIVEKLGCKIERGKELPQEGEAKISEYFGEFLWITYYPKTSRGFYYMEEPTKPGYNRDFNLLAPKGYGEIADGGEREYRYDKIVERLKMLGEDLSKYKWFLTLAKIGIPPSSGFGLGVERFTRYVLGLKYIWLAVPFPKPPGIVGAP